MVFAALWFAGIAIPMQASLWLHAVITIIHSLPFTFAGTGLREITLVGLLQILFDVPSGSAMCFSLVILLVMLTSSLGMLWVWAAQKK